MVISTKDQERLAELTIKFSAFMIRSGK